MNRTQKFALNTLSAALSHIIVLIAGLITPRLMITTYGSEINGLVSSLNQFITYIMLVEAGIGGAAIFSLYKPLAKKDEYSVSCIVTAARKSYHQAGYIFSAGIFALAVIYGLVASTPNLSFGTIFPLALILGVNGCLDFFLVSGYRVLLTADQRSYVTSTIGICQTILRTLIICLLAFAHVNVVLLYAISVIPAFLKAAMILAYGKRKYKYLDPSAPPDKTALQKRWDVIYQQILGAVQVGAPTVISTVLLNLKMVSVYSVYNMVISGINSVLSIFISGLPAGFGELIAKREDENLRKTVSQFEVAYYFLLSITYGVTFVMILPFVSLYTTGITDVNYYYPLFAFVIVLNGLLYNIKTPQSMLIQSAGMYKETRWRVTIQGIIILVFGVALGIPFGLPGIMIGSCLSNLYRTIDLLYFTPKYITHTTPWKSIIRMLVVIINLVLIALPSFIWKIHTTSYLFWAIYAIVYCIWALIVVTLTTLLTDRRNFFALLARLKGMFKRKALKSN